MTIVLLGALVGALGCDSSSETPDGGARADTGPLPRPTDPCEAATLLLEAIDPGTSLTLFNPTAAPVDVDSAGYVLCQRPEYPTLASLEAGVVIPPGGRHVFPWPLTFADTDGGGEVALYTSGAFADPDALVDFVCWGTGHVPTRQDVALQGGEWAGSCAGAITGESLRRVPGTDGSGASSYDATGMASPLSCP